MNTIHALGQLFPLAEFMIVFAGLLFAVLWLTGGLRRFVADGLNTISFRWHEPSSAGWLVSGAVIVDLLVGGLGLLLFVVGLVCRIIS